jgi:hypothetical protein
MQGSIRTVAFLAAVFVAALVAIVYAGTSFAQTGRWVPGNPYYIEESDASDFLEKKFDWAYCSGIPRFGQKGEFPYQEFLVFDCSMKLNGDYCSDVRIKAVKGSRQGYFRLKVLRDGDCF